jgi:peptidoglycan/xylan/chitin deacetylase (PgdA/CDA1 family)
MKKLISIILLTLMLSMTGCASNLTPTETQATPSDVAPTEEITTEADNQMEVVAEQDTVAEPEPSVPTAEEKPAEEKVNSAYYMDRAYRFKPIDPQGADKVVLLTFDDGPKEAEMLNQMLDILDQHEAKAIFFINGFRAEKLPELVQLVDDRGHAIGNHSWDHLDLKKQSEQIVDQQIESVQQLVQDIIGETPVFFRPPFGSGNEYVKAKVKAEGMLYMTWSNGSRDWEKKYQQPDKLIESVMSQLHPGSNILMHELPWTTEALDSLLSAISEAGYTFIDPQNIDIAYSWEREDP